VARRADARPGLALLAGVGAARDAAAELAEARGGGGAGADGRAWQRGGDGVLTRAGGGRPQDDGWPLQGLQAQGVTTVLQQQKQQHQPPHTNQQQQPPPTERAAFTRALLSRVLVDWRGADECGREIQVRTGNRRDAHHAGHQRATVFPALLECRPTDQRPIPLRTRRPPRTRRAS
jgi:hypothetical protein